MGRRRIGRGIDNHDNHMAGFFCWVNNNRTRTILQEIAIPQKESWEMWISFIRSAVADQYKSHILFFPRIQFERKKSPHVPFWDIWPFQKSWKHFYRLCRISVNSSENNPILHVWIFLVVSFLINSRIESFKSKRSNVATARPEGDIRLDPIFRGERCLKIDRESICRKVWDPFTDPENGI